MEKPLTFREIRYKEKRRKILEHAARIFAKKGYEKASLEEIAARLKLSKASLYHYIKSKDEVLYLIQMEALEEILAAFEKDLKPSDKPAVKLEKLVTAYINTITQKHIIGALRQQELILPKKWRTKIICLRDKLDSKIQTIIQEGLESGQFRALDWKMSYMAAIGALNGVLRWYSPQGRLSAKEISRSMADFILHGFGVDQDE